MKAHQEVEYYALDADRYCTEQAKLVLKAFVAIGIRTWAQNITNWSKKEVNVTNKNDLMETANKASQRAGFACPI